MAKWRINLVILTLFVTGCGAETEAPDTFEVFTVDVVRFGPKDLGSQDGVALPDALPGDQSSPTDLADDLPGLNDVVVPPDGPGPIDVADPPDLYQPPDLQVPDMGTVDAGPCGSCPATTPDCQNNKCVCNGQSCPGGFYCKGGECVPCNNDTHCGPECVSCASEGMYCQYDGSKCVLCDQNHPCPPGNKCIDGECQTCEGMGLCGPNCIQCPPGAPLCVNGACECDGASCGDGAMCEKGECVTCSDNDAAHCGELCLVCSGGAPHCSGGECTLCDSDDQCGPSCQACAEPTPHCRPDGASCAECLEDVDCGAGFHCSDYTCVENCSAAGCGSNMGSSGKKCSEAYIVGRMEAINTFSHSGDTDGDSNDDDLNYFLGHPECWDASYDNFFRIYLLTGDKITAAVVPKAAEFNVMLKLYDGTECDEDGTGLSANDKYKILCINDGSDAESESFSWTADKDGWFTVVVDGRQAGDDYDWGPYDFTLKLTCSTENCCCE